MPPTAIAWECGRGSPWRRCTSGSGPSRPTRNQMDIWLYAVFALCFLSPANGLVVLAAIAPFNEGIEGVAVSDEVGSKSAIAAALLLAIGLRWLFVSSARARPSAPVVLALLLLGTAGLGLIRTLDRWGTDFATLAAGTWIQGVATMLVVFVATVWIARSGARGPLVAAMVATTVAGLLSLVDYWGDAAIRESALGWVTAGPFNAGPPHRRHPLADLDRGPRDAARLRLPRGGLPRAGLPASGGRGGPRRTAAAGGLSHLQPGGVHRAVRGRRHRRLADRAEARDRPARGRASSSASRSSRCTSRCAARRSGAAAPCSPGRSSSPATSSGWLPGPRPGGCSSTSRCSGRATGRTASCPWSSATRS